MAAQMDECQVSWLTADLFVKILPQIVPDFNKILNFKCLRALKPGENYATLMLRLQFEVQLIDKTTKSINLMMKAPLDNIEFMQNFTQLFDIETGMYFDIVPELEDIYKQAGKSIKFAANAYKLNAEKSNILLEDLRERGFRNVNRHEGLDLLHAESVLTKIAQWHAASAVRVERKGPYAEIYAKGYFGSEQKEFFAKYFNDFSQVLMQCLEEMPISEVFVDVVKKFHFKSVDKIFSGIIQDPDEFLVLNHGDLWANNIMFQHDAAGNIMETYLVDYQVPVYSSPAHDLLYFILSSTKYELKLNKFDYFINFYHQKLMENLTILNYAGKRPSLKDLHIACIRRGAWAYNCAVTICAAVLADSTDQANLDNFVGNTEEGIAFKRAMFSTERYRRNATIILPWLINRGALEDN